MNHICTNSSPAVTQTNDLSRTVSLFSDIFIGKPYKPLRIIKILVKVLISFIFQFIMIFLVINYAPLQLNDYIYPDWANGVGWCLVVFSFAFIPGLMIVAVIQEYRANAVSHFPTMDPSFFPRS